MKRQRSSIDGDTVVLIRAPLLPLLTAPDEAYLLFKPFRSPASESDYPRNPEIARKLTVGYRFRVSSTGGTDYISPTSRVSNEPCTGGEDLKLQTDKEGTHFVHVDPMLTRWLREHQRMGVQFVSKCLFGLNSYPVIPGFVSEDAKSFGCILADDMGLGKTLQSITVLWTMLSNRDKDNHFFARKAIVICPVSLMGNWANELDRWLQGRCKFTAITEGKKCVVERMIEGFKHNFQDKVLVISYEAFRTNIDLIKSITSIDLMICDEAHRLKNPDSQITKAVESLDKCKMRILLTGTPLQNQLDELYTLCHVTNPGLLKNRDFFRKAFVNVIIAGSKQGCSPREAELARLKLSELNDVTNLFIIRRTSAGLLSKVLPDKLILNVFCGLSKLQLQIYQSLIDLFLENSSLRSQVTLAFIQLLLKVVIHPVLVPLSTMAPTMAKLWDNCLSNIDSPAVSYLRDRPGALRLLNPSSDRRGGLRQSEPSCDFESIQMSSGKISFIFTLLKAIRSQSDGDKVLIISNYTQTLDLIQSWCQLPPYFYPCIRLDGNTAANKRQTRVSKFNQTDGNREEFIFLLSSKAGGCGINLIGANRLIMVDPDWNPANDKQALARIWRDGQKKTCFIYRLFGSATVEEKIYQRQLTKENVASMVVSDEDPNGPGLSNYCDLKDTIRDDILEDLFSFDSSRPLPKSDTHNVLDCQRCTPQNPECVQLDAPLFDPNDPLTWSHSLTFGRNPLLQSNDPEVVQAMNVGLARLPGWTSASQPPVTFLMGCHIKSQREL